MAIVRFMAIIAEQLRRSRRKQTGQLLVAALQASPHREIDITPGNRHDPMPVRAVDLQPPEIQDISH